MPQCQAYGCKNKPDLCKGKSFFKIPNGKKDLRLHDKCIKWLHYIGTGHTIDSFVFSRHKIVCEDHFTVDCFTEDEHIRMSKLLQQKPRYNKILHDWAVPTVLVHRPPKQNYGSSNRMQNREAKKHAKTKEKLIEIIMATADTKQGKKKVVIQCCVLGCSSTNIMVPNILFFPFPKRREMLEIWLTALRKPEIIKDILNEKPCRYFICLNHFKESDLFMVEGRTCLKAGVVPSLFSLTEEAGIKSVTLKQRSNEVEENVVKVTCGNITGMLHRDRFYCPGIHHECIKYNNQFVTPKMFMIMGDKEKSKNWKSAIRVKGTMFYKCIESGKIKFYRHNEFCTGRCKPRQPQQFKTSRTLGKLPPDTHLNRSSNISHIKFLPEDKFPESCLQPQIEIENEVIEEDEVSQKIEEEMEMEDSEEKTEFLDCDEKSDYTTLRNLLINPLPSMITKSVSRVKGGITDNAVFWRGIVKLRLINRVFDVIQQRINSLHHDIIFRQVLKEDAHLLSSIVREMGLSDEIQQMLASCQQDMDSHFVKLDQEMEELKKKVQQYENKKEMLIQQSHKFREILELNKNPKCNREDSETESDEDVSRTTAINKRPSELSPYVQAALAKRLKRSSEIAQSASHSPPNIVSTPELAVSQILTPHESKSTVFPMFIVENKAFTSTKVTTNPSTLTGSVKDTIHMPNMASATSAKNENNASSEQLTVKEPIIIDMEKEFGSGNLKKYEVTKGTVEREGCNTSEYAAPNKVSKLLTNAPLKPSQLESSTPNVGKGETKKMKLRSINTHQSETVSENDVHHSRNKFELTATSPKIKRGSQDVDQSNNQKTNADQSVNITVNGGSQSKRVTGSLDIKLESVDSDANAEERTLHLKRPVVKLTNISGYLDANTMQVRSCVTKPLEKSITSDASPSVNHNVRRSSRKAIIKVVKDM